VGNPLVRRGGVTDRSPVRFLRFRAKETEVAMEDGQCKPEPGGRRGSGKQITFG
jgi:hypothetical protein